jgi:hypothetical protein
MSPTAKMPGMLVENFSVSTTSCLRSMLQAPFGDRAELGAQAEEHQQHVQRHHAGHAVGAGDLDAGELAVVFSSKPVTWPMMNCIS